MIPSSITPMEYQPKRKLKAKLILGLAVILLLSVVVVIMT